MDLTVIIATYNRNEVLCNTIKSVIEACNSCSYLTEIIVVDQSESHDNNTEEFLNNINKDGTIRLIKESKPSLPGARNIGIKESKAKYVMFLDDDVYLENDFINQHMKCYEKNPEIVGTVGKVTICNNSKDNILLNNKSSLKNLIKKFVFLNNKDKASLITANALVISDFNKNGKLYADTVIGCNMTFNKEIIKNLGGFDENYIGNAIREETDLCCRIKKCGYKIMYNSKAHLYHIMFNTGGCRNEKNKEYWEKYFYNHCYFAVKNFGLPKLIIKLNLIFDIWGCRKSNVNGINIINEKYKKVCKNLEGEY